MRINYLGRTFTLADSSCTTPGCPFSAGGAAGPCTGTSGYLSYKEIDQIISTNSISLTYDQTAAVKYFVYGGNQWVSYDDQATLKQKGL